MKTISTKFLPATDTKGARIKAVAAGTEGKISLTVSYSYGLGEVQEHAAAAVALAVRMGWSGFSLVAGATDSGYVFIPSNSDRFSII